MQSLEFTFCIFEQYVTFYFNSAVVMINKTRPGGDPTRLSVIDGACLHYSAYFIRQNSVPSRFVCNMRLSAKTVSAISGIYCSRIWVVLLEFFMRAHKKHSKTKTMKIRFFSLLLSIGSKEFINYNCYTVLFHASSIQIGGNRTVTILQNTDGLTTYNKSTTYTM